MSSEFDENKKEQKTATKLAHLGRWPDKFHGFINTPVYRGSTVLYPTLDDFDGPTPEFSYGRKGTPSYKSLCDIVSDLDNAALTVACPSGLSAITTALLAFVKSGDHILVTDSIYLPTRKFCESILKNMDVETEYYDPEIGSDIKTLIKTNTRLIFTESPGSQSMEMQDIPAIVSEAKKQNILVFCDNTWASPVFFKPLDLGVDIAIQAATKYIVGHSDAMLGVISANTQCADQLQKYYYLLGNNPGSEEVYLGTRGIRTMQVRLKQHMQNALKVAEWLSGRDEVFEVRHPGLPGSTGHEIWKRDFTGSSGLFSILIKSTPRNALGAMLDDLKYFGMGFSWGGFESLIIPFDPTSYRTVGKWDQNYIGLRLHIGLEDPEDLIADLADGFQRMKESN